MRLLGGNCRKGKERSRDHRGDRAEEALEEEGRGAHDEEGTDVERVPAERVGPLLNDLPLLSASDIQRGPHAQCHASGEHEPSERVQGRVELRPFRRERIRKQRDGGCGAEQRGGDPAAPPKTESLALDHGKSFGTPLTMLGPL